MASPIPHAPGNNRIDTDRTIRSIGELWKTVAEIHDILESEAKSRGIDETIPVWYRGHASSRFKLLPTLCRFQIGLNVENQIHNDYAAFRNEDRGWNTLFHMQHYNAPTRLLDWTTDLATALYFAFDSAFGDNPVLWILHPGILNRMSGFDPRPTLPAALKWKGAGLNYPENLGNDTWPNLPFAIMPPVLNPRIQAQRGMFTVQGHTDEPLDKHCARALARIVFDIPSAERDLLRRLGPRASSIFPDEVGMAQSLNHEYQLPEKAIESTIRANWKKDGAVPGTAGCITNEAIYVPRQRERQQLGEWLEKTEMPVLLLTARAAAGKTNFIVKFATEYSSDTQTLPQNGVRPRPILLFSLGHYLDGRRSLIWRLADSLRKSHADGHSRAIDEHVLERMIRNGQVVLVLDGLDELLRNRGDGCLRDLAEELKTFASNGVWGRAKIVIACRDHIANRLEQNKILEVLGPTERLSLDDLDGESIKANLESKHRDANFSPVIGKLIEIPLLYGVFIRSSEPIVGTINSSTLWPTWLRIAGRAAGLGDDDLDFLLAGLRRIAAKMLKGRDDYLADDDIDEDIPEEYRKLLNDLTKSGDENRPVFVREQDKRSRFIHQAIREYVIARDILHGLRNPAEETVLTSISDLDYESAEAYRHLSDMLGDADIGTVFDEVDFDAIAEPVRSNFARNFFEAQGMLGVNPENRDPAITRALRDAAIGRALRVIQSQETFSGRVRHNAARCLTRLHPTSPWVYCRWASKSSWPRFESGELRAVYGYAVRGFHRREPALDCSPPEIFFSDRYEPDPNVCEILLEVISVSAQRPYDRDAQFVQANCSHALIRWFHPYAERRCGELMRSRTLMPETRMNFFLTLCRHVGTPAGLEEVLIGKNNRLRGDLAKLIDLLDKPTSAAAATQ